MKKGPGTNFQLIFFLEIFDKYFSFAILYKLAKFHNQTLFTSQVIQKTCFMFHDWAFDDPMAFEYLKS